MSTSETQQAGLVEQLKARLDEIERITKTVAQTGTWGVYNSRPQDTPEEARFNPRWAIEDGRHAELLIIGSEALTRFIALNDPVKTLAMVAAHRKILALHYEIPENLGLAPVEEEDLVLMCGHCEVPHPCETVKALAKGYQIEVPE